MNKLLLIVSLFILASFIEKNEEFEIGLIPTKTGALFAYTSETKSFTIELVGEKIQPLEQKYYVIIDGWIFQSFILSFDNTKNYDFTEEEVQKSSLSQYVDYEVKYFQNELIYSCDSLVLKWEKINEKYFYFWYFNTPKEQESIKKQLYLSTICHNQILNINIPLQNSKSFEEGKEFLFKIAESLKINNYPLDFNELYQEMNK